MVSSTEIALGMTIPPHTPHAVSVSLPKWSHNVAYEEGDPKVTSLLTSGYPRFVIHKSIQKLFHLCIKRYAIRDDEICVVLPTRAALINCKEYVSGIKRKENKLISLRTVEQFLTILVQPLKDDDLDCINDTTSKNSLNDSHDKLPSKSIYLYILIFPADDFPLVKQFWQHTGEIISSRFAEFCLRSWHSVSSRSVLYKRNLGMSILSRSSPHENMYYRTSQYTLEKQKETETKQKKISEQHDHASYVEERFGRNMSIEKAEYAKFCLKRRIAGLLEDISIDTSFDDELNVISNLSSTTCGTSENDVWLFPSGMSAIYHAFLLTRHLFPDRKSVQFGFPYLDTLKIQTRFNPHGCHFLGYGNDNDLQKLKTILKKESISTVFCEFPSNPLLQSPDLQALSYLAQKHGFLLVVDETIGTYKNVDVLSHADIVVSSLTKVFSGDSNVMGGSLVFNDKKKYSIELRTILGKIYQDGFWDEDAVFLERNSRNFKSRVTRINLNTEALVDIIRLHPKVKHIYFPKYADSKSVYERHAKVQDFKDVPVDLKSLVENKTSDYAYGGLFSIIFNNPEDAIPFYDRLAVAKGPSLGTNFTLCCPYTILAHYTELDWADSFGVSRNLVRVSVGTEPFEWLKNTFIEALN